jgi:hypothetical protein
LGAQEKKAKAISNKNNCFIGSNNFGLKIKYDTKVSPALLKSAANYDLSRIRDNLTPFIDR